MKRSAQGFGLIEIMISLVLGLIVVAGILQIFISAKNTYASQNAAAVMQEDARFILTKMTQEIRMVGMFGCLDTVKDSSTNADFAAAERTPIRWDSSTKTLTLVTADVGSNGGIPTWTVLSDCKSSATAVSGVGSPTASQLAFPVRQLVYQFANGQITLGGAVIVNNVNSFSVLFGLANTTSDTVVTKYATSLAATDAVRSVRLTIELKDATGKVENQTFSVLAALRNLIN
ncbi:PilW family protein [Pseudomonas huanghezhanensis]|uniref:PilW family protein n=1 Tax=Pseudomonas huanghezhanensis TaxID=3002903 RepID=UPI00228576D4|nr:prepilin-type N-terminal cleavage/methylation domain-containing protein [Pseudomonas sp. BSw22131]